MHAFGIIFWCTRVNARIWIWIIKNTLKLTLARFSVYSIYTVAQKSARTLDISPPRSEIRDSEQRDRTFVYFKCPI